MKVLIILDRFFPGYRDGGPVLSIANLIDALHEDFEFTVLTKDRDVGDDKPYPFIKEGALITVDKGAKNLNAGIKSALSNVTVIYANETAFDKALIVKSSNEADLVYMGGCFTKSARLLLSAKAKGEVKVPVIEASFGLFDPGTFAIKFFKKKAFMLFTCALGWYKNIYWSATSQAEADGIVSQAKSEKSRIFIAQDLPRRVYIRSIEKKKPENGLRIVYLSRISESKNMLGALKILEQLGAKVNTAAAANISFDIYGPTDDEYWQLCQVEIKKLKETCPGIAVTYHHPAPSTEVVSVFEKYDVFLFPTMAENYCHAIQEALSAGCIPVISDRTPWEFSPDADEDLVGHIIPMGGTLSASTPILDEDAKAFADTLLKLAELPSSDFQKISDKAIKYAAKVSDVDDLKKAYIEMFNTCGNS